MTANLTATQFKKFKTAARKAHVIAFYADKHDNMVTVRVLTEAGQIVLASVL